MDSLRLIIGMVVIALSFPVGNFLARTTKEELKSGQGWFKSGIFLFSLGAIISIITKNDILLFTFLFMVVVTSRSIIHPTKKLKKRK